MLKKLILASAILAATTGAAVAAPYIGASTGITVNTATNNAAGSFRGVPFNVFAGYGQTFQSFYLAGELNGTVATSSISNGNGLLKTTYSYGASIIPGIMLGDHSMIYARAGVVKTRFNSSAVKSTQTGGAFGLGLQTSLTQNVDVRTEYTYTNYGNVTAIGGKPRSDAFTVGLVYKFD